jgi:hypothetical protein
MSGAIPAKARGQAATEYLVVLACCVIGLFAAAAEPAPIHALLAAIKGFFAAYSFAISLTP